MKNFTPDERAADANIENTRGRAKPDTKILWRICRRTYKCGGDWWEMGRKWWKKWSRVRGGRGKRRKEQDVKKSGRYGRNTMRDEGEKHLVR